jgi:hypothetical protein
MPASLFLTSATNGTNVTTDDWGSNDSSYAACLTILNFKKNPHLVLPQTTIYAIIGVYRCLIGSFKSVVGKFETD